MSLINQMLKELDARRSDGGAPGQFGAQVRAVPVRRRVHPAWWLALALALTLLAVIPWIVLRPAAPDPYAVRAQLPLRLEVDIASAGEAAPLPHPESTATRPSAARAPLTDDIAEPVVSVVEPAAAQASSTDGEFKKGAAPAEPIMQAAPAPGKIGEPKVMPAAEPAVSRAPVSQPEVAMAGPVDAPPPDALITKQVREPSTAQRAENEYRKATLVLQQGRRTEAQAHLEQALQLDPKHAGARQALIALLIDAKRSDEAMWHAREGMALDTRQAGLAMILARLQLEKNDLRGAIETLEGTRKYAGERADYPAFLAALLQRAERHKEAADEYLLALQRVPENGLWWMGLGISLQAVERTGDAREAFMRARASNTLTPDLLAFVEARLAQLK